MNMPSPQSKDFRRLFRPSAIAIVGASADEGSISGQPLKFLRSHGYSGAIYPVNPKYQELAGLACYPDIATLPTAPDVALVAVAARRVPEVLRQCGEKGAPFAIVLTSGFAESGEDGARAQGEIAEIARRYDIGVIGPNCQGMINIAEEIYLGFGTVFGLSYRKGTVSLMSQSGGFGYAVLMLAKEEGLRFRQISRPATSRHHDAGLHRLLHRRPRNRNHRRLCRRLQGRSARRRARPQSACRRQADAHVESRQLRGRRQSRGIAHREPRRRAGFVSRRVQAGRRHRSRRRHGPRRLRPRVARQTLPSGNRLAVITISGGAGILMADRCADMGLALPALRPIRW